MNTDVHVRCTKKEEILRDLELLRQQMIENARRFGMNHPIVMYNSKRIDYLIIEYYKIIDKRDKRHEQ
ncbi:aspartyl-phosphate phosphatase Spo0E family protein [Massilibacterium senegalense]|uniref:aspartyl-phosphate phosphatase Spo0E family protein n=1 Tax=Massilibacterium senegalense TaxID=1632858 RepID=UPI0007839904|nr:aspartyl-phosphate phosphatase Spo0E family protein [Massilibacterium senegalense]